MGSFIALALVPDPTCCSNVAANKRHSTSPTDSGVDDSTARGADEPLSSGGSGGSGGVHVDGEGDCNAPLVMCARGLVDSELFVAPARSNTNWPGEFFLAGTALFEIQPESQYQATQKTRERVNAQSLRTRSGHASFNANSGMSSAENSRGGSGADNAPSLGPSASVQKSTRYGKGSAGGSTGGGADPHNLAVSGSADPTTSGIAPGKPTVARGSGEIELSHSPAAPSPVSPAPVKQKRSSVGQSSRLLNRQNTSSHTFTQLEMQAELEQRAVLLEREINREMYLSKLQKVLCFGDCFQLCHIHSRKFVGGHRTGQAACDQMAGSLTLHSEDEVDDGCWLTFLPVDATQQIGEQIPVGSRVCLALHSGHHWRATVSRGEVNLSDRRTGLSRQWTAIMYRDCGHNTGNEFMFAGMPVSLNFPELEKNAQHAYSTGISTSASAGEDSDQPSRSRSGSAEDAESRGVDDHNTAPKHNSHTHGWVEVPYDVKPADPKVWVRECPSVTSDNDTHFDNPGSNAMWHVHKHSSVKSTPWQQRHQGGRICWTDAVDFIHFATGRFMSDCLSHTLNDMAKNHGFISAPITGRNVLMRLIPHKSYAVLRAECGSHFAVYVPMSGAFHLRIDVVGDEVSSFNGALLQELQGHFLSFSPDDTCEEDDYTIREVVLKPHPSQSTAVVVRRFQPGWRTMLGQFRTVKEELTSYLTSLRQFKAGFRAPFTVSDAAFNRVIQSLNIISDMLEPVKGELPSKKAQAILLQQRFYLIIYRLVTLPFDTAALPQCHYKLTTELEDEKPSGSKVKDICRLSWRILRQLVQRNDTSLAHFTMCMERQKHNFLQVLIGQLAFDLNARRTLNAIVLDNDFILKKTLLDGTKPAQEAARAVVQLMHRNGKHARYLITLSRLCVCRKTGLVENQNFISHLLFEQEQNEKGFRDTILFRIESAKYEGEGDIRIGMMRRDVPEDQLQRDGEAAETAYGNKLDPVHKTLFSIPLEDMVEMVYEDALDRDPNDLNALVHVPVESISERVHVGNEYALAFVIHQLELYASLCWDRNATATAHIVEYGLTEDVIMKALSNQAVQLCPGLFNGFVALALRMMVDVGGLVRLNFPLLNRPAMGAGYFPSSQAFNPASQNVRSNPPSSAPNARLRKASLHVVAAKHWRSVAEDQVAAGEHSVMLQSAITSNAVKTKSRRDHSAFGFSATASVESARLSQSKWKDRLKVLKKLIVEKLSPPKIGTGLDDSISHQQLQFNEMPSDEDLPAWCDDDLPHTWYGLMKLRTSQGQQSGEMPVVQLAHRLVEFGYYDTVEELDSLVDTLLCAINPDQDHNIVGDHGITFENDSNVTSMDSSGSGVFKRSKSGTRMKHTRTTIPLTVLENKLDMCKTLSLLSQVQLDYHLSRILHVIRQLDFKAELFKSSSLAGPDDDGGNIDGENHLEDTLINLLNIGTDGQERFLGFQPRTSIGHRQDAPINHTDIFLSISTYDSHVELQTYGLRLLMLMYSQYDRVLSNIGFLRLLEPSEEIVHLNLEEWVLDIQELLHHVENWRDAANAVDRVEAITSKFEHINLELTNKPSASEIIHNFKPHRHAVTILTEAYDLQQLMDGSRCSASDTQVKTLAKWKVAAGQANKFLYLFARDNKRNQELLFLTAFHEIRRNPLAAQATICASVVCNNPDLAMQSWTWLLDGAVTALRGRGDRRVKETGTPEEWLAMLYCLAETDEIVMVNIVSKLSGMLCAESFCDKLSQELASGETFSVSLLEFIVGCCHMPHKREDSKRLVCQRARGILTMEHVRILLSRNLSNTSADPIKRDGLNAAILHFVRVCWLSDHISDRKFVELETELTGVDRLTAAEASGFKITQTPLPATGSRSFCLPMEMRSDPEAEYFIESQKVVEDAQLPGLVFQKTSLAEGLDPESLTPSSSPMNTDRTWSLSSAQPAPEKLLQCREAPARATAPAGSILHSLSNLLATTTLTLPEEQLDFEIIMCLRKYLQLVASRSCHRHEPDRFWNVMATAKMLIELKEKQQSADTVLDLEILKAHENQTWKLCIAALHTVNTKDMKKLKKQMLAVVLQKMQKKALGFRRVNDVDKQALDADPRFVIFLQKMKTPLDGALPKNPLAGALPKNENSTGWRTAESMTAPVHVPTLKNHSMVQLAQQLRKSERSQQLLRQEETDFADAIAQRKGDQQVQRIIKHCMYLATQSSSLTREDIEFLAQTLSALKALMGDPPPKPDRYLIGIAKIKADQAQKKFEEEQCRLSRLGATRLALVLCSHSRPAVSQTAIFLLEWLLINGNQQVQNDAYDWFSRSDSEPFFRAIEAKLNAAKIDCKPSWHRFEHEQKQMKKKSNNVRARRNTLQRQTTFVSMPRKTTPIRRGKDTFNSEVGWVPVALPDAADDDRSDIQHIMSVLQLLCEGHNAQNQNYLRDQSQNKNNYNLISTSCLYLSEAFRYVHSDLVEDVHDTLSALIEFCQGPCLLNQSELVRYNVIQVCNFILAEKQWDVKDCMKMKDNRLSDSTLGNQVMVLLCALLEGQDRNHSYVYQQISQSLYYHELRVNLCEEYARYQCMHVHRKHLKKHKISLPEDGDGTSDSPVVAYGAQILCLLMDLSDFDPSRTCEVVPDRVAGNAIDWLTGTLVDEPYFNVLADNVLSHESSIFACKGCCVSKSFENNQEVVFTSKLDRDEKGEHYRFDQETHEIMTEKSYLSESAKRKYLNLVVKLLYDDAFYFFLPFVGSVELKLPPPPSKVDDGWRLCRIFYPRPTKSAYLTASFAKERVEHIQCLPEDDFSMRRSFMDARFDISAAMETRRHLMQSHDATKDGTLSLSFFSAFLVTNLTRIERLQLAVNILTNFLILTFYGESYSTRVYSSHETWPRDSVFADDVSGFGDHEADSMFGPSSLFANACDNWWFAASVDRKRCPALANGLLYFFESMSYFHLVLTIIVFFYNVLLTYRTVKYRLERKKASHDRASSLHITSALNEGIVTQSETCFEAACCPSSLRTCLQPFQLALAVMWENGDSLAHFLCACFGIAYTPLWFCVMLPIQWYSSQPGLKNAFRALTETSRTLLELFVFMLLVVWMFTFFFFKLFRAKFVKEEYEDPGSLQCDTMSRCFVIMIGEGWRAGGGIGDYLKHTETGGGIGSAQDDSMFVYVRLLFEMAFFISVVLILLNIVFGVMIDKFSELRDRRSRRDNALTSQCFTCQLSRSYIDLHHPKGHGYHIQHEHNMWDYMMFAIHVMDKDPNEYTGVESSVAEMMDHQDYHFMNLDSEALFQQNINH